MTYLYDKYGNRFLVTGLSFVPGVVKEGDQDSHPLAEDIERALHTVFKVRARDAEESKAREMFGVAAFKVGDIIKHKSFLKTRQPDALFKVDSKDVLPYSWKCIKEDGTYVTQSELTCDLAPAATVFKDREYYIGKLCPLQKRVYPGFADLSYGLLKEVVEERRGTGKTLARAFAHIGQAMKAPGEFVELAPDCKYGYYGNMRRTVEGILAKMELQGFSIRPSGRGPYELVYDPFGENSNE